MQKRAPNRYPPKIWGGRPIGPAMAYSARSEELSRQNMIANFSVLRGYTLLEPTDSYRSIRLLYDTAMRIESLCELGELDALRVEIQKIRESDDPIMNRPDTWKNRWDIIKFLTEIPFAIHAWFGQAVADLALHEDSTEKLQWLFDLGWDLNENGKDSLYKYLRKTTTALCRVTSNEQFVRWFLERGADPNRADGLGFTSMHFAAREASLESIKLLMQHGGKVEGSDLVAQAAIGHIWGRKGRYEVMEFLLGHGAPINAMALEHSVDSGDPDKVANNGGQTALNVAQISGDEELAQWLLQRGADPSIEPVNRKLIEEYPYIGEGR